MEVILLAIGLAASDKLDRTYLPPPGAKYAGGRPEDLDAPLELPHQSHPGIGDNHDGLSGGDLGFKHVNYGDKIPKTPSTYSPVKVPTTTTSYAFAQTTTFPTDSYETTALPINPVTGLPINFDQTNQFPGLNQVQIPTYGQNVQPGNIIQGQIVQGTDGNQGYGQPNDQPLNQYPGLNVVVPGEVVQIPGTNQGLTQYPDNQVPINGQQGVIPNGAVNGQYPGQNVIIPGGAIKIPVDNQVISQYPYGQTPGNPNLSPTTASPQDIKLQQNYGNNYPGLQGSFDGQPIHVANPNEPHLTQGHQHQEPINVGGQPIYDGSGRLIGTPNNYNPSISGPMYRPERPQAAADRNAVILNYENVRYPNGYSYSYDTSNGIHADETGTVGNGTRAQGSYSYTGDDGKVYTVVYTADENGFRPYGDHLPTPPPIPEAIQKVIEQAARDEAAGIFDDGSYDEEKYGDKKYLNPKGRRPQKQNLNRIKNRLNGKQDNQVKPIAGITDVEEDQQILDQNGKDLPNTETRGKPTDEQNMSKQTVNQEPDQKYVKDIKIGNKKMLRPNKNLPIETASNQLGELDMLTNKSGKPITVAQRVPVNQQTQLTGRPAESDIYNKGIMDGNNPTDYPKNGYNGSNDKNDGIYDVSGQPIVDFDRNGNQYSGQKPNKSIGNSNNGYNLNLNGIKQKPQDNSGTLTDYIQKDNNQPQLNQQDESGYYYQKPNVTYGQTKFPTRFSTQEPTTVTPKPDQAQTEAERRRPLRPFITPGVYTQNERTYSPTTRRPFTTIGVTSPQNAYTDYDDDDYEGDQDIDDGRVSSTKVPIDRIDVTARPNQFKTSGPQYIPTSQKTYAGQKGISPGRPVEQSNTSTPRYSYGSTTPSYQTSRFGTTEAPQRNTPYQRKPVISQITNSNPDVYNYGTTKPTEASNINVVPGYKASSNVPVFGTRASTPIAPTTLVYPTSTYRPAQDYSVVTGEPQSTVYRQRPQPISGDSSRTGYYYEPPTSVNTNTGFFNPRPVSSTMSPDVYQTSYPQGSNRYSNTTPVPTTPSKKGTFILTESGSNSPIDIYQGFGPSTPNYSNLEPSSPGSTPVGTFDFNPQTSTGYKYGSSRPVYSTTPSVSTYGPTPTAFIPSETPGIPKQGYSTTYRPIENGPLVDGFGRPIPTDQGTYTGYPVTYPDPTLSPQQNLGYTGPQYDSRRPVGNPTTGPIIPSENGLVSGFSPEYNGNLGSTTYPVPQDGPQVIGEDFSGPKQPQRFDPKTGYHY
ncbi:unnamed protein product [Chrysodeixis includens]|uniref:Uncharacterized protein n=1 Tax=Chrysodeixis includens TaxID=689277 RepID=A0A9N8Q0Z9_CHRIL|nr:unnamed protein product [Chrysodeixis includens]